MEALFGAAVEVEVVISVAIVRIIIITIEIIQNIHIDHQVDQIIITIIEVETIEDQTEIEVDQIGIITGQIGVITGQTGIIIIQTGTIMDIGIIIALQIHFDQIEINHVIIIVAIIQTAHQEIFAGAGITTDETKYYK